MKKKLPLIFAVIFTLWFLSGLRSPAPKDGFNLVAFGKLPVLLSGRVQPMDSMARNALLQIRAKQSVAIFATNAPWYQPPKTMNATEWLLEVMTKPALADSRKLFRIDSPELQGQLKLTLEQKHYSYAELKDQLDDIEKEARRISDIDSPKRTANERQLLRLYNGLLIYFRLKNTVQPEDETDFAALLEKFRKAMPAGVEAVRAREAKQTFDQAVFDQFMGYLQKFHHMQNSSYALIVPPLDPAKNRDDWRNAGTSLMESARSQQIHPAMEFYGAMLTAYQKGDAARFNSGTVEYQQWLAQNHSSEVYKGSREYLFNQMQVFYKATVIYLIGFLFAAVSLFNLTEWLRKTSFNLVTLAWIIHTAGLLFRMILEGRPPVTNLYSSAIFIGWGAVILGLALEKFFPLSIGILVASLVGFVTQIIAHNLALGGDTMEMMRAVLDSNFWLATHVVVVTLGYSATFIAGFIAIIYVVKGAFTSSLNTEAAQALSRMVYSITCFAALFSFVGTVLGGIWADQSWGRFWGWDPKENGALLIVIWNAVYLHARWGGICRERGLMAIAIFGNIVTAWSWFGVNMLGVGLHAYGFMDAAFKWLMLFGITQMVLIVVCFLPDRNWKSAVGLQTDAHSEPESKT